MAVYEISYDLNKSGQNYDELHEAIKSIGDWAHPLKSTWWVETHNLYSEDIYNKLEPFVDKNDYLFVSKITSDYYGWLKEQFWEWLKPRI